MTELFDKARAVADAVLYEGYLLYPYTADSPKNQVRWQFGVLMPPSHADDSIGEYTDLRTECLLEAPEDARVHVRLRFLRIQQRSVESLDERGQYRRVASLPVGDRVIEEFDEAVEQEHDLLVRLGDLIDGGCELAVRDDAARSTEEVRDQTGELRGRIVRELRPLRGRLRVDAERIAGPYGGLRLRVSVVNTSEWRAADADRQRALRHAFVATHLLLGLDQGSLLSSMDPPEWAAAAVAECENVRCWPVLLGPGNRSAAVLAAPIILYDDPRVAPESPRQLHDATEIDEILTLRTMALTEQEKQQARQTDERARDIIDGVDDMPPEMLERLHGTLRYLRESVPDQGNSPDQGSPQEQRSSQQRNSQPGSPEHEGPRHEVSPSSPHVETDLPAPPGSSGAGISGEAAGPFPEPGVPWWDPGADAAVSPENDSVEVDGQSVSNGSKVTLRPRSGGDAQDMFLTGRIATVRAVYFDVDGGSHLAVTLDDDPGAEIQGANGRFRYFGTEEVSPLAGAADPSGRPEEAAPAGEHEVRR
ncbi:hypothetical protein SAMN04487820_10565 [Actinopolyspora mzabensis]|uniref:Uncharacterized protein n=1 Tax=Actinopolyspora mzabensis TaxID=995066 RepID=A0A1G8ZPV8_ACTMZ|nr:proline-rich domain-containing protein [Actinopolyspora mzabensis]SDK17081.1 hypothetical protein SAMN04487820_10565 [Actinopolyspora mzabensis]